MIDLKGHRFEKRVIFLWVRWYLATPLNDRNLEERIAKRGVAVDHAAVSLGFEVHLVAGGMVSSGEGTFPVSVARNECNEARVSPAPATVRVNRIAAMAEIAGLDIETGLRVVSGKWESYTHLLGLFVQNHANDGVILRTALIAGNGWEARRVAHTLKSVAATLGARALSCCARELEQEIEAGVAWPALESTLVATEAILTPLLSAVRRARDSRVQAAPTPALAAVDRLKAGEVLTRLEALLAEDGTQARTVWLESTVLIEAAPGSTARQLQDQINRFEFDKALLTLRAALGASRVLDS